MSTLTRNPAPRNAAPSGAFAPESDFLRSPDPYAAPTGLQERPRLYRGRTIDELIPRIVSELGEDAIVIRHHKGLTGGFAGFFQRPFVEIEARRGDEGGQLLDRYDEEDAAPALPGEYEDRQVTVEADDWDGPSEVWATNPFAEALADAEAAVRAAEPAVPPDLDAALAAALAEAEAAEMHPEPTVPSDLLAELPPEEPPLEAELLEPLPPVAVPPSSSRERAREEIECSLLDVGVGEEFVHALIEGVIAHVLPLMPASTSLAQAVHTGLTQRIPVCPPLPAAGAAIALVGAGGSGKSACCAALLEAYREHSTLPATCTAIVSEPTRPAPEEPALREGREGGLLLLDTPPLSPSDQASIGALAATLQWLQPDRVVLALPATLGAKPAGQLLEALRPLGASALVITHADATDQLGVAVQIACTFGLAPTYLLEGGGSKGRLAQIDPTDLVDRLLPLR